MVNGGVVNHWACLNFSRSVQENYAHSFCSELAQMCQTSGMVLYHTETPSQYLVILRLSLCIHASMSSEDWYQVWFLSLIGSFMHKGNQFVAVLTQVLFSLIFFCISSPFCLVMCYWMQLFLGSSLKSRQVLLKWVWRSLGSNEDVFKFEGMLLIIGCTLLDFAGVSKWTICSSS